MHMQERSTFQRRVQREITKATSQTLPEEIARAKMLKQFLQELGVHFRQ